MQNQAPQAMAMPGMQMPQPPLMAHPIQPQQAMMGGQMYQPVNMPYPVATQAPYIPPNPTQPNQMGLWKIKNNLPSQVNFL